MSNREMYNSSGCLDMTAYIAIRNIEREEKRRAAEKRKAIKNGGKAWAATQQISPSVKRTSSC